MFLNDYQNADEIWFMNFEIGPVTMSLIGTIGIVFVMLFLKYVFLFVYRKAKVYGLIKMGARPYGKYFTSVVFLMFFLLSYMAKIQGLAFDSPVMLVITTMMLFVFIGFTITSDLRTMQILLIAVVGSFLGHLVGTILVV